MDTKLQDLDMAYWNALSCGSAEDADRVLNARQMYIQQTALALEKTERQAAIAEASVVVHDGVKRILSAATSCAVGRVTRRATTDLLVETLPDRKAMVEFINATSNDGSVPVSFREFISCNAELERVSIDSEQTFAALLAFKAACQNTLEHLKQCLGEQE